jgi:hypothetical protein
MLPGVSISTAPGDYTPFKILRIAKFDRTSWRSGIGGVAGGALLQDCTLGSADRPKCNRERGHAPSYPVRIVAFNAIEGWSCDVTSEVADELAKRLVTMSDSTLALQAFIEANATQPFAVQLALPLRGAA